MNYAESGNLIYGSISSGIHRKTEHHDTIINDRIQQRMFSGTALQPNLGFQSSSTRQTMFPILEQRNPSAVPLTGYGGYCVHSSNPTYITQSGPPSTYLANIDIETSLQNRVFALQRPSQLNSCMNVYVPHSSSDLYNTVVDSGNWDAQPHELLFKKEKLHTRVNPVANKIGNDQFFNHTRTQLRGL